MTEISGIRTPHPCIARSCGHPLDAHVRTPELESSGEIVLYCSDCRSHEVRSGRRFWSRRRARAGSVGAYPSQAG